MHERMHAYYVTATVVNSKDLDHTAYHHRLQKKYLGISKSVKKKYSASHVSKQNVSDEKTPNIM